MDITASQASLRRSSKLSDPREKTSLGLSALQEVLFTGEAYGPITLICCWAKGYQEPLYVVTNLTAADKACRLYEKRFRIETFFSDQKSRGFHLHKSHLADPKRLSRLFIAAC